MIEVPRSAAFSAQLLSDSPPCCLCGKPIHNLRWEVHMHGGGSVLLSHEESATGNHGLDTREEMGMNPIGPECVKKVPKEYRFKVEGE